MIPRNFKLPVVDAEVIDLHNQLRSVAGPRIPSTSWALLSEYEFRAQEKKKAYLHLLQNAISEGSFQNRKSRKAALGALRSYGPVFVLEPDLYQEIDSTSGGMRFMAQELIRRIDLAIKRPDFRHSPTFTKAGKLPMKERLKDLKNTVIAESKEFFGQNPAGYLKSPVVIFLGNADRVRAHERFHALMYQSVVDWGGADERMMALGIQSGMFYLSTHRHLALQNASNISHSTEDAFLLFLSSHNRIIQAEEYFARIAEAEKTGIENVVSLDMDVAKGAGFWTSQLEKIHTQAIVDGVEYVKGRWGTADSIIAEFRANNRLPPLEFEDD